MSKVTVIGAGSWGTAIAWVLGENGHEVTLWVHNAVSAASINDMGRNPRYLNDVELRNVMATTSHEEAVRDPEAVFCVVPSVHVREMARAIAPYLASDVPVVMLSKGVEAATGKLMTDILDDEIGGRRRIAALSGPNHAEEISRGLPAGTVVASESEECATFIQRIVTSQRLRVYTSTDVTGVELCGACKNIYAIGCGVTSEQGYGDNTAATLMTRGLAEMSRLVVACGGETLTCMGLAGMGDLIATCTSSHSRNRTLGQMLANGYTLEDFERRTHMVAEGAVAVTTVTDLARRLGVEMPVAEAMRSVLAGDLTVADAVDMLFDRNLKAETHGLE